MATLDTRSTAQRRTERKVGHIETARQCGHRCARLDVAENDPKAFLDHVGPGGLTSRERRARRQLLPSTWSATFAQGWRTARDGPS